MIIVDRELERREEEGRPVRVGLVGAGYMGRGISRQLLTAVPGMRLAGISNRTPERAESCLREAGAEEVRRVDSPDGLERADRERAFAYTDDPRVLCRADAVDVVVEATGDVEFGARVALETIENGKHLVLMNAEVDATVGPVLKTYADGAGVVMTNTDGDQPGVVMNLFRWVKSIGYRPVLVGNVKGLYDPYRTPETQKEFAEAHDQRPPMVTSFADGTKLSMEMAVTANATGFGVARRGMHGPECEHVREAPDLFDEDELLDGGIVDYVLGAEPGPGVFVLGWNDDPVKQQYMDYLKMGDGPLYTFYVPYHLPHLEVPLTAARAELFEDPAITPEAGHVCDVLTVAKRDLEAGTTLDGIGGFTCYGLIDDAETCHRERLLPMGLCEGCRLTRDVGKDEPVRYDDVELPEGRAVHRLRREQDRRWWGDSPIPEAADAATAAGRLS